VNTRMPLNDVFLSSQCFISLVASVAEGFKSEVGGLLFGDWYKTRNKVVVDLAIPLQTAIRSTSEVHFHPRRTKRVHHLWDNLSSYWPLGTYHSHPEYGDRIYTPDPSKSDIESMEKGEIELIIAIRKAKRRDQLRYTHQQMRIAGAIGKYFVELAAWYCPNLGEVEKAELWCPYIEIINLSFDVGIVTRPGQLYTKDSIVPALSLRTLRNLVREYEKQVFRNCKLKNPILTKIKRVLKKIKNYTDMQS
jgi:proteasome lid subunit RPN8/RPN11